MKIHTDSYKVAPINEYDQAIKVIKDAESLIANLTGNEVTLIAYEKTDD